MELTEEDCLKLAKNKAAKFSRLLPKDSADPVWDRIEKACNLSLDELIVLKNDVCMSVSSNAANFASTQTTIKKCCVVFNGKDHSVGFDVHKDPREYVIEEFDKLGKRPTGHSRDKKFTWEGYILINSKQQEVVGYHAFEAGEKLYFKIPDKLRVLPSSEWRDGELESLQIDWKNLRPEEFLSELNIKDLAILMKAQSLISELEFLTPLPNETIKTIRDLYDTKFLKTSGSSEIGKVNEMRTNPNLEHPIAKCLYLIQHYSTTEGIVDALLSLLFWYLGFYEDMLFPFPQKKLKLYYNNGEVTKEAKPDYTIMDVLSFYRVAVCEDKNCDELISSEPQMIAEAIAVHQANIYGEDNHVAKKQKCDVESPAESSDVVYGIRVHGFRFYFYIIPVSDSILNALRTQARALEVTVVSRLGGSNGLSFLDPEQRKVILNVLNGLQVKIANLASNEYREKKLDSASNPSSSIAESV